MTTHPEPDANAVRLIPLAALHPSPLNPRKHFDPAGLAELADSICRQGVLQNLVARPHPERPGEYEVAAGERRRRAAALAVADGRLPADFALPVAVRPLDDDSMVALGLAENVGRHDLTALEEARAYRRLRDHGADTLTIARTAGRSQRHVQLRLDLLERLAPEALAALEKGVIAPEQARELCRAPKPRQKDLLAALIPGRDGAEIETAAQLHAAVQGAMVPLENALFPRDRYTGPVAEDGEGRPCADDVTQFHRLQRAAIKQRRAELLKRWPWVDVVEIDPAYTGDLTLSYPYRAAEPRDGPAGPSDRPRNDALGAVIYVAAGSLKVAVHEKVFSWDRDRVARRQAAKPKKGAAKTKTEHFDKYNFAIAVREARLAAIRRRVVAGGGEYAAKLVVLLALGHFEITLDPPADGPRGEAGVPAPLAKLVKLAPEAAWAALARLDGKALDDRLADAVAGMLSTYDDDALAQLGALIGAAVAPEALDKEILALCGPEQRAELAKDLEAEIKGLAPDAARKLLLGLAAKKKGYVPGFLAFPKPELPPAKAPPSPGKKPARVKRGAKR